MTSARNLGQLLRSCRLLGVDSFLLSKDAWPSLNGRCMAVAQGLGYGARLHRGQLQALQGRGLQLLAAECCGRRSVAAAAPTDGRWALVLGNEERGVSREALKLCEAVRVPQRCGEGLS